MGHGDAEWTNPFFLAMAHWRLGNQDKAREWYQRAVDGMQKNQLNGFELRSFRAEAEELMGIAPPGSKQPTTDAEPPTAANNENQKPPTTNN